MAYEIGTAAGYKDLLERLKEFITDPTRAILSAGQDIDELDPIDVDDAWEIKRWDTDYDGAGEYELIASGPGVTGQDGILIGIQTYPLAGVSAYNWRLAGMTAYSGAADFYDQAGIRGNSQVCNPHVLLDTTQMPYWFIANGRRVAGVARVAGVYYASFYLGYILPYGTPAQITYPLYVGGSAAYVTTQSSMVYSASVVNNRGYTNPYYSATDDNQASAIFLHGQWIKFANYQSDSKGLTGSTNIQWPYLTGPDVTGDPGDYIQWYSEPNLDGGYSVFPIVLISNELGTSPNVFGELHGIFYVHGTGVVPEDTITIDGKTYVVFQNGRLSGDADHFAMLKE